MMQRRQPDQPQKKPWRSLVAALLVLALAIGAVSLLRRAGGPVQMSAVRLPCTAGQGVTPFGENVLYYDGAAIHCVTASGAARWSLPIGEGAAFSVGEGSLVAWAGSQLYILDRDGNATYSDNLGQTVQFAKIGKRFAAAVIGAETKPRLVIRDLNGQPVDEEADAFADRMMLDVGFYGEDGQYIWTLAMDVFGTVANTMLNTFEVGQMNTGEISLGQDLTYKVIYDNQKLRVVSTRQMRTFNYRGTEDLAAARLVYGWKVVAHETPAKGDALMLLAPSNQTTNQYAIREVRLLSGALDSRYTLPSVCVGVAVRGKTMYAFAADYIYRADAGAPRFSVLNRPQGMPAPTDFFGMTTNGRALLASGDAVYAVTVP